MEAVAVPSVGKGLTRSPREAAKTRFLALLICALVRALYRTLRLRIHLTAGARGVLEERREAAILATWHGCMFIPIAGLRGRGYYGLVSLSRDGDLQAAVLHRLGYKTLRGSTRRRGAGVARDAVAVLEAGGVIGMTPDGPRGPARRVHPGVVYLAQRSGCAIIPQCVCAAPCWRLRSWDRFQIPRPFSRVVWLRGDPLYVAPEEDLAAAVVRVEQAMLALDREAEDWLARRGVPPDVVY